MRDRSAWSRGVLLRAGQSVQLWLSTHSGIAALLFIATAALLVFVLPLFVPVRFTPTVSASYVAGFDNHTAVLASAGLGVLVLLWTWRTSSALGPRDHPVDLPADQQMQSRLRPRFVVPLVLLTWAIDVLGGWLIGRSHLRYIADLGYFIEQLSASGDFHRHLYSQLEFAYGPLLFYPTIWIHALLHSTWLFAYIASLMLDQGIGLAMLVYCLNALPMRARDRKWLFVLLALGAINPLLGLNYTFFRFLAPLTAFLLSTRPSSPLLTTVAFALSGVALLGISPELALAFLAGAGCYAALQAWRGSVLWLMAILLPAALIVLVVVTAGQSYLRIFSSFSRGTLNLPVAPYPDILVLLAAAVWLVPRAAAREFLHPAHTSTRMVACYFVALGMLPAALGRCDPLHVFFNGSALLVLSGVAMRSLSRPLRTLWTAALIALVCWVQWVNNRLYFDRTIDTVRIGLVQPMSSDLQTRFLSVLGGISPRFADRLRPTDDDVEAPLDLPALERQVGSAQVATPMEVSLAVEQTLKRSHHYRSDFYGFFVDVMNPLAESHKIASLNEAQWALIPTDPDDPFLETPQNIGPVQGFTFPYRARHPLPYPLGQAFRANLDKNWTVAAELGDYRLYRNLHPTAAP